MNCWIIVIYSWAKDSPKLKLFLAISGHGCWQPFAFFIGWFIIISLYDCFSNVQCWVFQFWSMLHALIISQTFGILWFLFHSILLLFKCIFSEQKRKNTFYFQSNKRNCEQKIIIINSKNEEENCSMFSV